MRTYLGFVKERQKHMKENKWWKEIEQKGHFCPNLVIFYAF